MNDKDHFKGLSHGGARILARRKLSEGKPEEAVEIMRYIEETWPGETWPPDAATQLKSLARMFKNLKEGDEEKGEDQ